MSNVVMLADLSPDTGRRADPAMPGEVVPFRGVDVEVVTECVRFLRAAGDRRVLDSYNRAPSS